MKRFFFSTVRFLFILKRKLRFIIVSLKSWCTVTIGNPTGNIKNLLLLHRESMPSEIIISINANKQLRDI